MSVRWEDLTLRKAMQCLMWRLRTASKHGTATDSLEDMVDYDLVSSDGWMSGTWMVSDAGLGVMESSELYVIYHVEDGSIEITGKTEADNENNASYIGVYYPVE